MNFKKAFIIFLSLSFIFGVTYAFVSSNLLGGPEDSEQEVNEGVVSLPQQTTRPGVTTESEIRDRGDIIETKIVDENTTEYIIDSGVRFTPSRIVAEDSVVVHEAVSLNPDNYKPENYPKIIDLFSEIGNPIAVYEGSVDFGPFVRTYVYPERGFSFVGKPATDEVVQMHFFTPTTLDGYLSKHADDFVTPESYEHGSP